MLRGTAEGPAPGSPPAQAWHRREQGSSQAEDAGHQLPPRGPPRCGVSQRLAHAHSRSLTLAGTGLPLKGQARGQCGGVLAAARAALAHVPAGAPCTGPQRPPPLSRGGTEVLFRQGLSPSAQGTLPGLSPGRHCHLRCSPPAEAPSPQRSMRSPTRPCPHAPRPRTALPDRHTRPGARTSSSRGAVRDTGAGRQGGGSRTPGLPRPPDRRPIHSRMRRGALS